VEGDAEGFLVREAENNSALSAARLHNLFAGRPRLTACPWPRPRGQLRGPCRHPPLRAPAGLCRRRRCGAAFSPSRCSRSP
jgi:hypothetical protein